MLLAIDIGNTNTAFGVYDGKNLIKKWRLSTDRLRISDELGILLRQFFAAGVIDSKRISAVIASSVVPELNNSFNVMSKNCFDLETIFVDYTFDFGVEILYETPQTLGADRLVDAFAAVSKYGKPCIICDFGTAATIDAVNSTNQYLGGIIAPGINLLAAALAEKTAALPKIEIVAAETIFGRSTAASIRAGIYYGYIGFVENILRKMIGEMNEKPKIIATGGFARLIAENSDLIDTVDESLLLDGLRLMHEKINS